MIRTRTQTARTEASAKFKTVLLTGAGLLLLTLGIAGILVPIWPTTPFLLAAVGCLTCAPRLRARIIKVKYIQQYLENYRERNGLPKKTVMLSLSYLWCMLLLSAYFARIWWVLLILGTVGVCVSAHILIMAKPRKTEE